MFDFTNSVRIDRPVNEVFRVASDLTVLPRWNYFIRSVTPTSGNEGDIGATYHQVRKSDEQDLRIVEVEEDRMFIVETVPPSKPSLRRTMELRTEGEETIIVDHWQLDLEVPRILEPLAGSRVQGALAENLRKLRSLLETGAATLQDGRKDTL